MPGAVPQLVMSLAPCRCDATNPERCPCTPAQQSFHQRRVVAPLRARADIHLHVHTPIPEHTSTESGATLPELRQCVSAARARGSRRRTATTTPAGLAELPRDVQDVLGALTGTGILATTEVSQCLRVAQTFADLDAAPLISPDHIARALTLIGDTSRPPAPSQRSV